MRINNNISALNTLNQIQASDSAMSRSLERLSSGLRINRAADDAAGLAISEKMRNQIKGLTQARRNAQDGVSLIQTAEGALNETHSILNRMRELAVQASNDTLTDDDRDQIQKESNLLIDEVDRISTDTEFNTRKLLNGDASSVAKKGTGFNDYGEAVTSVKATSTAQTGTYKIQFNTQAAAVAMGTITRTTEIEADYKIASGGTARSTANSQTLASSLTTGTGVNSTYFNTQVTEGTFFINGKEIRVENKDNMYTLLHKINTSGAGVGADVDNTTGEIYLIADKDAADNIKLEAGTSNFLNAAGLDSPADWTTNAYTDVAVDGGYLTGGAAGSVRLVNLEGKAAAGDGPAAGLIASDVITVTGKVGGQLRTDTFNVGTSTVSDLLHNIENTFGGVTATMEKQRPSAAARGTFTEFSENLTLRTAFQANAGEFAAAGGHSIVINGVTIDNDGAGFNVDSDTIQTFINKVNEKSSQTGVTAALDRDSKKVVFSSANNIRMDITSGGSNLASTMGLTNDAGTQITSNDMNRLVIKGQDGSANAVTDISITATDATGTTNRTGFNSLMGFTQMQVARDKGDFIGAAQLNILPSTGSFQQTGVAVKTESVNTELIKGVQVSIGAKIDTGTVNDKATVSVGTIDGSVTLQIGANKGQTTAISIEDMGAVSLGLKTANGSKISLATRADSQNALDRIDSAIEKVSTQRAKLGAYQNRLEHTVTNLGVSTENLQASESRIRDLDMAKEMSDFTRNQILMQAGTSMMAQANQKTQGVMKLLG